MPWPSLLIKKFLYLAVFLIILNVSAFVWLDYDSDEVETLPVAELNISNQSISVEVATRTQDVFLGLSGRPSLPDNSGMLFLFSERQDLEFVMRNMKFPLDIIFLDAGRVVKIWENLAPEGGQPKNIFSSGSLANQALEINAGQAKALGLKVGDQINIPTKFNQ